MDELDAVVAAEAPGALDLHVVLVAPHVRHRGERLGRVAGEQRTRRVQALLGRVGPVLDAHELVVEARVRPPAHVAGGHDVGRGVERGVAHHAVVEREARTRPASPWSAPRRSPRAPRRSATALPSPSSTRSTRPVPAIACTSTPRRRSTPCARCRRASTEPMTSPTPRTIGWGSASSTVTSRPEAARRRRDLGADEPGADHAQPRVGAEQRHQPRRVLDGAQQVHAVEVGLVRERARVRAGGDDEPVVGDGVVTDADGVRRAVEVVRGDAEPELDVEIVEAVLAQRDLLAVRPCRRGSPSTAAAGRRARAARRRRASGGRRTRRGAGPRRPAARRATRRRRRRDPSVMRCRAGLSPRS